MVTKAVHPLAYDLSMGVGDFAVNTPKAMTMA